jgi:hypothetical protein
VKEVVDIAVWKETYRYQTINVKFEGIGFYLSDSQLLEAIAFSFKQLHYFGSDVK